MNPIAKLSERIRGDHEEAEAAAPTAFSTLRLITAQVLLAASSAAVLDQVARRRSSATAADDEESFSPSHRPLGERAATAVTWAPLLLGPAAAIANTAFALQPSENGRTAARVLNAAAAGAGLAATIESIYDGASRHRTPSLTSLALGSAALFGSVLESEEAALEREMERLERRAEIVERLVPRRRGKLDHIVVHV